MKNERTATVTWHKPEEQLPEDSVIVLVVCDARAKNVVMQNSMELADYDSETGKWILECWPEVAAVKVKWWCELPCVPDEEADAE